MLNGRCTNSQSFFFKSRGYQKTSQWRTPGAATQTAAEERTH